LVFVFSAITLGIKSVEVMWPFDQMFSPQSPPQNNQTNSSKPVIGFASRPTFILKTLFWNLLLILNLTIVFRNQILQVLNPKMILHIIYSIINNVLPRNVVNIQFKSNESSHCYLI